MADYSTPNEIVVIIRILGETRNNYVTTEKIYAETFPDRRHPKRMVIKRKDMTGYSQTNTLKNLALMKPFLTVLDTVFLNS